MARSGSTWTALPAIVTLALSACAPATQAPAQQQGSAGLSAPSQAGRTLVAAVRTEPDTLALRAIRGGTFAGLALLRRFANADLTLSDENGALRPYLAEDLPRLNTDTWRVFPDGRMETTWRLKPGVVWHDGVPLTAGDFIFAWRVYTTPDFVTGNLRAIPDVAALDDRTLVVRYPQPYPDAGKLGANDGLPPLPRHLLEASFQQVDANAFANNAFWSREYVGLGPYRLDRWQPGSFLEGAAFDKHVLGRPRIDRVRILFISDVNTSLANLLAGQVDFVGDSGIGLEQAWTLKGDWEQRGAGSVRLRASQWRFTTFQLRPELATPRAILEPRVRKALAHAVDKQALNEHVYHGEMAISDFFISPLSQWGPAIEGAVQKYPYDPRRAEQLMAEAGFTKGPDGTFASPTEGRFKAELKTPASPDWEAELAIMANDWRKTGFDVQESVLPAALTTDLEARVTFPAMFTSTTPQGEGTMRAFAIALIPRAENRWRGGSNRGGWESPEYDRILDGFTTTLEPSQRGAQVAQMARIFSEDLPIISLLFLAQSYAHVAALQGVLPVKPEGDITSNIYEWEFR